MQCRLRSYDIGPPGNYSYTQTQGIKHEFEAQPLIEAQAQIVSAFRAGNGLPRASVQECIVDIDRFTAARIGCHQNWCVPVDSPADQSISIAKSHPLITPCAGCGAQLMQPT